MRGFSFARASCYLEAMKQEGSTMSSRANEPAGIFEERLERLLPDLRQVLAAVRDKP